MIDAHRLIFNGFSTENFDVTAHLSFGGDSGATPSFLNREGVYTEHYDGHRTIHRAKHNEAFTPRFTLVKKNFSDFNEAANRRILSWLTASDKPGWLEVYKDDSNVLSWRVFGCITSVEQYKLGNGRVVGYEFEVESSHPYAWSYKFTYPKIHETIDEVTMNDENNDYLTISSPTPITLTCTSDEYSKLLYPQVTIKFDSDNVYVPVNTNPIADTYEMMHNVIYTFNGKYYIDIPNHNYKGEIGIFLTDISTQTPNENTYNKYYFYPANRTVYKGIANDDATYGWEVVGVIGIGVQIENRSVLDSLGGITKTILIGNVPKEEIVLNGTNKVISTSLTSTSAIGRTIGDDFNWVWLPLAEGENEIVITGNCKIKFEWIEPRKVGSL